MKTLIRNHSPLLSVLFATMMIAALTSCSPSDQTGNGVDSTAVDPPEIDIHTAVLTGNQEVIRQHIAAGSNINEKDPFGGSSPLISAALFGKTEEAKMLLDAGADINFQNNDGATPLHIAAFFCRPEIVQLLLDRGADKSIKNKFGATPYESVSGPFSEAKNVYDMIGQALAPMGLKLDYAEIEKTRPVIAGMLK